MAGQVITFYSFKGGVGRSFALSNIAVLLARWGFRVLCVDWDLEAPGLHHYFADKIPVPPEAGVVDLVDDFKAGLLVDRAIRLDDTLDLIPAGGVGDDYFGRMQVIDWERLYDQGFGEYLEQCRARWTERYDFVLVDSRTGVSDTGGICTSHLPDRLVLVVNANLQSIQGAVRVARKADAERDAMPLDRPRLAVVPVLSRFDTRDEYAEAEAWRDTCLRETAGLFANWLDARVPTKVMASHLVIPYVSYWALGERLAVERETTPSADQISYALETVAAVLAHDLDRTALLADNRDSFVAAIRDRNRAYDHTVRVSSPWQARDLADEVVIALTELGLSAERALSGDRAMLDRASDAAEHLCLLVDGGPTRWQAAEAELFLRHTIGQDRRVFLVLTAGTNAADLPGYLANLRHLLLGSTRGAVEVAQDLHDQLHRVFPLVDNEVDPIGVLARASKATMRLGLWQVVRDLVQDLNAAAGDGDDVRVRELTADLDVLSRTRSHGYRVPVPTDTRAAIDYTTRVLRSRFTSTD
ncbi:tyrosine-protein kinase family protein [Actinokineospora cianjurensis]|uniref:CobQ/CobB/MinD/ParA family nucleotide binding protein n=1 Tax=Actinokineospora cianjurensis TaxID=585224 RepID=A0A421AYP7_9PSEU|nr:AAA family ATPase [Actinokineospora cianjurensis]RLK54956.1 CobQ/CobB/MinD/ParA family nucleotide binding protein [Actinokineospora cianjurensis]